MEQAWFASRYDKGTADYINCPMNQEEYDAFWQALTTAQEAEVHGFEDSRCLKAVCRWRSWPGGGMTRCCYGPLKPVGLDGPADGAGALRRGAAAAGQCRRARVYNLVGFQTHLKFPEQKRVFSMIPALRQCGICALRRHAPQYLLEFPPAAGPRATG